MLRFPTALVSNINKFIFVCRRLEKLPLTTALTNKCGVSSGLTKSISSIINMPEHLAQGSAKPPLVEGKLRLYGMRFCPYDQRVHLVLIAKNIPHDNVWINLRNKPDWYIKQIPSTKVPGLIVDGQVLYESLVIADFLDEKFAEKPLHSKDPLQKAKDRILIEGFSKVISAFYKLVMSTEMVTENVDNLMTELAVYDKELGERGSKFFAGNEPGMLDYMIWPWFERFSAVKIMFGNKFDIPESKHKNLIPWVNSMMEDKVVKKYIVSPEPHVKFIKSFVAGEPVFDIPL